MFPLFLCFFTLFIGNVFAEFVDFNFEGTLPLDEETLMVSLGAGCDGALTLRDCGLRKAAFPFDWVVSTNHEKFIELLDNDFEFFTDENFIAPLKDPRLFNHPNSLINTYYDILFYHEGTLLYDWSDAEKYQVQLERVKFKYHKRINRFRKIRSFPGKVFFIRNFASDTPHQANRHSQLATELRDALRRYFPDIDFTLVIVTYTDVQAPSIEDVEDVIEFHMDRAPWREEHAKMYQYLLNQDSNN